jgi:YD repeat-containing protein
MKATYDHKTDALTFELKSGPVAESDEDKPGVILDYDKDGNLIGIEVLDASKRVAETRTMQFQVAE